jgi:hypothetical protein
MNLHLPLLFFCLSIFTSSFSQKEQVNAAAKTNQAIADTQLIPKKTGGFVMVKSIDRGDYFYIPNSAFADSVDAVLFQDKTLLKLRPENRPVKCTWTSNCNDGDYILTVTPEQIFLSSGHENPNPNYLFWTISIKREQFQAINNGIRKKAPRNFYDGTAPRKDSLFQDESEYYFDQTNFRDPCAISKNWNKTTERKFSLCCDTTIIKQTKYYFKILNRYITNEAEKLKVPDVKDSLEDTQNTLVLSRRNYMSGQECAERNNAKQNCRQHWFAAMAGRQYILSFLFINQLPFRQTNKSMHGLRLLTN